MVIIMKQFIVIGCGKFGEAVATTLVKIGHQVLVVDKKEDVIQDLSKKVTHAVIADIVDKNSLIDLGIKQFDVAVVAIGDDIKASIMVTLIVKELGVKYVVAKANDNMHAKVLYKIGADRIVYPERDMGMRIAHNLVSSDIVDLIELAPEHSIMEIKVPENWIGKDFIELNVRKNYNVNIIAIKSGDRIIVNPSAKRQMEKNDVIVVLGHNDNLKVITSTGNKNTDYNKK